MIFEQLYAIGFFHWTKWAFAIPVAVMVGFFMWRAQSRREHAGR